ncbi:MAG: hypothetical protein WC390_06800 [Sulfurimonas sp.]
MKPETSLSQIKLLVNYILGLMDLIWYNYTMTLQERKDKADIIAKRGELIYKKLLLLVAIAGGSWIYGIGKADMASYFALLAFFLSSVGVVANLVRLGQTIIKIKEIENEY